MHFQVFKNNVSLVNSEFGKKKKKKDLHEFLFYVKYPIVKKKSFMK